MMKLTLRCHRPLTAAVALLMGASGLHCSSSSNNNGDAMTTSCDGGGASSTCFSKGYWKIDNLEPCFLTVGTTQTAYASTQGNVETCPFDMATGMPSVPAVWSTDSLEVDCAGTFKLCYTIKAGDPANPQPGDCTLGQTCVTAVYPGNGHSVGDMVSLGGVPGWQSDPAMTSCVAQFLNMGGYAQMSVAGQTDQCQSVNKVFQTVTYCPTNCNGSKMGLCGSCQAGGGGPFTD